MSRACITTTLKIVTEVNDRLEFALRSDGSAVITMTSDEKCYQMALSAKELERFDEWRAAIGNVVRP